MAYTVDSDQERRLIDVRYADCVTIEQRFMAYRDTQVLLEQTGFRRILIDYVAAQPHADSFADINAFASSISNDPVLRQCRIAFVGEPGQLFNATVEMLADARHYPFRPFHDRESATDWLMEDGFGE